MTASRFSPRRNGQPVRRVPIGFRFSPFVSPLVAIGRVGFVRCPVLELREQARPATRGGVLQYQPRPFLYRGGAPGGTPEVDRWSRAGKNCSRFSCCAHFEFRVHPMDTDAALARVCDSGHGAFRVLPHCPPVRGVPEASVCRACHYKALSPEGNPEFATGLKGVKALGLRVRGTTNQP
jgi:hypothetical protein